MSPSGILATVRWRAVKILSVVGNRPQFVKSAPLSVALREAGIEEVVAHTGQHWDRELSQVFFEELGLGEPAYRLDLHTADTDAIEAPLEEIVRAERPDWVLVYGDTNSTLAGARAATAASVPLAHVEAGLRSGDLSMPEEHNRIEVDRLAQLLLAPDERSRRILLDEGSHRSRGSGSRSPTAMRTSSPPSTAPQTSSSRASGGSQPRSTASPTASSSRRIRERAVRWNERASASGRTSRCATPWATCRSPRSRAPRA
jgi:UDP-N-acetylglucosamine 2-epimerase